MEGALGRANAALEGGDLRKALLQFRDEDVDLRGPIPLAMFLLLVRSSRSVKVRKDECQTCNGEGYVPSGVKSDALRTKDGTILKLTDRVPVQMPCPRCNAPDE